MKCSFHISVKSSQKQLLKTTKLGHVKTKQKLISHTNKKREQKTKNVRSQVQQMKRGEREWERNIPFASFCFQLSVFK